MNLLSSIIAHNDNLPIHEDKSRGVYVKNLSDFYVGSAPEVYQIMKQGGEARKVSSTSTRYLHCFTHWSEGEI